MTLIKRKYRSVPNHTFLEKVAGVFMLLALVFIISAILWTFFLNPWFDRTMSIPSMYQYPLAFSLALHLPAWVCLMLACGFGAGSLVTVVLAVIEKSRSPKWTRCSDRKTGSDRYRSQLAWSARRNHS